MYFNQNLPINIFEFDGKTNSKKGRMQLVPELGLISVPSGPVFITQPIVP